MNEFFRWSFLIPVTAEHLCVSNFFVHRQNFEFVGLGLQGLFDHFQTLQRAKEKQIHLQNNHQNIC